MKKTQIIMLKLLTCSHVILPVLQLSCETNYKKNLRRYD